MAPAQMGKQEALKRFATNLTEKARKGEIDPVSGRDEEIRQIVDILMRRRQNNPILTGEAGVGKTAVVEGFAVRLARGDVPPPLQDVSLYTLDIGLLQAGASMKGEFENRLRQVIDEVQASPKPIILFVDEAHTLIGAGGAAGTGDAANLLKPALARGTLRTIAATTWAEYKKYIEKDPALTRRFQVVKVEEPSEDKAILMVRGVASVLEKHHRVQVLDEALEAAVRLSHRYIPGRQLPDKAVSLLDTACARVAISQHGVPPQLEDCRRTIEGLQTELEIIGREETVGINADERRKAAEEKLASSEQRRASLEERWNAETRAGGARPRYSREAAQGKRAGGRHGQQAGAGGRSAEGRRRAAVVEAMTPEERQTLLGELAELQQKLSALQGESPLILPSVDEQAVGSVVQDWTGVPVGRMVKNEIETVLNLAEALNQRVIGQRHALDMIAQAHSDIAREARQPEQADRRLHAVRSVRRRQDRNRADAGGGAVRRRAERHHDQHERVPGGAHRLDAQGIASRLRRIRRGRRADRSGAAPPVQRRAAGRGRESAFGRPRAVLPGLRQGLDGGRRGPAHRLQEHDHPADVERRHRADHEHVQGPRADARARGHREGAARAAAEEVPGGAARTAGRDSVLPAERRDAVEHRPPAARENREAGGRAPQDSVQLRRRGGEADRQPVHRGRERRAHDRRHPDEHGAAGDQPRVSRADDGRGGAERRAPGGGRRRFRVPVRLAMEQVPTTDRAVSLDEAVSIAIQLQQNEQWVAAGDMYRRILEIAPDYPDALHFSGVLAHQQGRSDEAVALIERSLELEPDRADWHSNLGIVLRDRLQLDEAIAACRARDCARSESRQRAQQSRRPAEGAGQAGRGGGGVSRGDSREPRPLGRVHQPRHPAERPEADRTRRSSASARSSRSGRSTRRPGDCWRWRTARSARSTRRWASSRNGCEEEPDDPIALHMLAACSGRDVPARASDGFVEKTFDSFAGSFDSKLAKLLYRAPALVAGMLADSGVEASKSLDVLDAGCGTGLCGPLIAPYARRLVGRRSVGAHADCRREARHVYDELFKVELTAYLRDSRGRST